MSRSYEGFAGILALMSIVGGLGYAAVFLRQQLYGHDLFLAGLSLTLGGLLSQSVMVAVYLRVRSAEPAFAALGLLLVALRGQWCHYAWRPLHGPGHWLYP
jgi:hypothetical protein